MNKTNLLQSIAQSAYDIGFGGKKHFITYDILRITPRAISVLTMILGVYQLLTWYKENVTAGKQDFIAATLIAIGLIALVIDLLSDSKEEYNLVGKRLLNFFNELRRMHLTVSAMDETSDFSTFIARHEAIVNEASTISISKQTIFTHWLTHFGFFYVMQSKWVVSELKLTWRDKYPIMHMETYIIAIVICVIGIAIYQLNI